MTIQPNRSTRDDDDFLLMLLQLRRHHGSGRIANHFGLTSARVRSLCNRILDDDIKHSGEDEAVVRSAYWRD